MTTALSGAVELLERSLGYTRVSLGSVTDDDLGRQTPCSRWLLADLLAHMEDALHAFTSAAGGSLSTAPAPPTARVDRIRDLACGLLGVWTAAATVAVDVDDRQVDAEVLLGAAALEITVHGWDVAHSLEIPRPIPDQLALELLARARGLVTEDDRVLRFAGPRPVADGASAGDRLLAYLGRPL